MGELKGGSLKLEAGRALEVAAAACGTTFASYTAARSQRVLVKAASNASDQGRLQAEANIHFQVSYGCVHILAAAGTCLRVGATPGLVLEWHEHTLARALSESSVPLSKGDAKLASQRMQWLAGIASGLAHLHQLGVW